MSKTAKTFFGFLLIGILVFSFSVCAFATEEDIDVREDEISVEGSMDQYMLKDGDDNLYSTRTFSTVESAKTAFGWDFAYEQCYRYFNGVIYNWFYWFTDGTKCYFHVIGR